MPLVDQISTRLSAAGPAPLARLIAKRGAPAWGGLFALAVVALLSRTLPSYYLFLGMSAAITSIVLIGLGVVSGSAGMISLCQMSFAAIGGWTVAKLNQVGAPGGLLLWVFIGGLVAVPFGIGIGLPALRLRGIHLAVVTLGFATASFSVVEQIGFPGSTDFLPVARPSGFAGDRSYFLLCWVIFIVIAVCLAVISRRRLGATWRTMRHSERATAAAGYSVARAKLIAFGISAFVAGVGGGLLAGQVGLISAQSFTPTQSLIMYVLAVMLGAHYGDGAAFGGVLSVAISEALSRLGLTQNWLGVIFGIGAIQALAAGKSLSEDVRERLAKRKRARQPECSSPGDLPRLMRTDTVRAAKVAGAQPTLVVQGLSVRYGAVHVLTGVDLTIAGGSVSGLIGPNGAGKSTLTDAVSGFISHATGDVWLAGRSLAGVSVRSRAEAGLRRTFQQDRVPSSLTVEEYLRFACHNRAGRTRMSAALNHFACPPLDTPIARVDVGTRRLLELAGVLLAEPSVVILDEPAAGLGHDESVALGERLAQVPDQFGATLLLIEHDLDVVRAACTSVTVLNFGSVLAAGPPAEVLADPAVVAAYLGEVAVAS